MNSRLRILFLLPDPPYPVTNGMRWKVFFLLKLLSKRHHCDVLCFVDDPKLSLDDCKTALPDVGFLKPLSVVAGWRRIIRAVAHVARGLPPSFARYGSKQHRNAFMTAVKAGQYDVIHYDIVNMAQFLSFAPLVPSVHSPNDATSLFYRRMALSERSFLLRTKLKVASALLRYYERANYARFSKIHVVSGVDADYLKSLVPQVDVVKIHFGVDDVDVRAQASEASNDAPLILVLGGSNVPGIAGGIREFLANGVPRIFNHFPEARIRFHGRDMEKFLAGMSGADQVEISSWVEDFNALIDQASIVVLPDLAGTGLKTRALQSMARGKPVVGTDVAFEGFRDVVVDGEHCLIAHTIEEVTIMVEDLIGDKERCCAIGENAAGLITQEFSWSVLIEKYADLYGSAVSKGDPT